MLRDPGKWKPYIRSSVGHLTMVRILSQLSFGLECLFVLSLLQVNAVVGEREKEGK